MSEDAKSEGPPVRWIGRLPEAYGYGIVLFLILRELDGGWLPPVTILRQFSHLFLLLCAPLLLVALARGRRRASAALLVGLIAFAWTFRGSLLPVAPPEHPGEPALRVLTLNLGDHRTRPGDFAPYLRASGADLVALQEVGAHHVEGIRRDLADVYPHQVLHGLGMPGMGLLSKLPLADAELLVLRSKHPYLAATAQVDGRPVGILAVHPRAWIGFLGRLSAEGRDLVALCERATAGGPCILLGDLNSTEQSWAHDQLSGAGLIDAWQEAGRGFGFTFPLFLRWRYVPLPPILRIDQVWHTRDFEAVSIDVGPDCGSDHLPLVADLAWR